MKTTKAIAFALSALVTVYAANAHATAIQLSGDSSEGFGGRLIAGEYIGEGGQVRLAVPGNVAADQVIDGGVTIDFDFRYQRGHVGLRTFDGSNNGQFTLTNGDQNFVFGSHDLDANGVITTDAFDGSLAGGDWIVRLDNPNGGDPWAAFSVASSFTPSGAGGGNGGGGNGGGGNGGGGNGGGGNGGGGQVPVPAPLTLIGAMAAFALYRRKRAIAR